MFQNELAVVARLVWAMWLLLLCSLTASASENPGAVTPSRAERPSCALAEYDYDAHSPVSFPYDGSASAYPRYDGPRIHTADEWAGQPASTYPLCGVLAEFLAAKTATEINASKFDYLFGNVTSDAHNTARSLQNAAQLNRIGIQNTAEGVQILTENLTSAAQGSENIINAFSKTLPNGSVINLQTRGSLLSGPGGFLKLESTWQVMPDGTMRFTTAIPIGGH